MAEMTWEEKLVQLRRLAPHGVDMTEPGRWFVSTDAMICCGPEELSYGKGASPQEAVEAHWESATLPGNEVVFRPKGCTFAKRHRWYGSDEGWVQVVLRRPRQTSAKPALAASESANGESVKQGHARAAGGK